jgi:assimilatory nitrate reductase catalytic subunit
MNVHTTCPYCGVSCGIVATPDGRGRAGSPAIRASRRRGRLAPRAPHWAEPVAGRPALHPGDRRPARILGHADTVAGGCDIIAGHGPTPAFYVSDWLLTEDYAANKLIKGFLGTASIEPTRGSACLVGGRPSAFGGDRCPASTGLRAGRPRRWSAAISPGATRAVQRPKRPSARAGNEDVGDRSAPHRDLRPADLISR